MKMSIIDLKLTYLFSVILRGFTLFSKFALIIILAKILPIKDVGLYGLISAVIGYTIFLVGFEFYTYSMREMISSPKIKWMEIIRNQIVFYIFIYIISTPIIFLIFYFNVLPINYIGWFCAIFLFEHIAQEINRILVAEQKQLLASMILFIRQGAWCWGAILAMWFNVFTRGLETVFAFWITGTVIACIIGAKHINTYDKDSLCKSVDWKWIRNGIFVAVPMLIASLAIRGIFTFDRFYVEKISGLEVLGAYVLFASMASAIQSFLDTVVITFSFPKLVKLSSDEMFCAFRNEIFKLSVKVVAATLFFSISCWIFSFIILKWLSHESYITHVRILATLIIATAIYCFSLIPHLGLYALRCDRHIIISQVLSFFIFIIFCSVGLINKDVFFVPIALIASFSFLFLWKTFFFVRKMNDILTVR